jgi:hypothetical protein
VPASVSRPKGKAGMIPPLGSIGRSLTRPPPHLPPSARLTIQTGTPNLSALFSLQNVTPIHVAPAVWLGLHWRGLRGEAVLAGMASGLAVTVGLVFSPLNVGLAKGLDSTACGLSTAMIGFFVNIGVTVTLGLALQRWPTLLGDVAAAARRTAAMDRLDIGPKRDKMLAPLPWALMFLMLLFCAPICFRPGTKNRFIGAMAVWPFISLLFSGVLAIVAAYAYLFLWEVGPPGGGGKGAPERGRGLGWLRAAASEGAGALPAPGASPEAQPRRCAPPPAGTGLRGARLQAARGGHGRKGHRRAAAQLRGRVRVGGAARRRQQGRRRGRALSAPAEFFPARQKRPRAHPGAAAPSPSKWCTCAAPPPFATTPLKPIPAAADARRGEAPDHRVGAAAAAAAAVARPLCVTAPARPQLRLWHSNLPRGRPADGGAGGLWTALATGGPRPGLPVRPAHLSRGRVRGPPHALPEGAGEPAWTPTPRALPLPAHPACTSPVLQARRTTTPTTRNPTQHDADFRAVPARAGLRAGPALSPPALLYSLLSGI